MISGLVGICVNILLFAGKLAVGLLCASVSITADAVNNLSDAGSSVITLVSFRISAKPADRKHPFGHARIEYIASMIVSLAIMMIGLSLLGDSASKAIFGGEPTSHGVLSVVVLCVSIAAKLGLFLFFRGMGRRIDSDVLAASASDSISDAASSAAVLLGVLISYLTSFDTDAYIGIAVAIFILVSGIKIFIEATNRILGEAPGDGSADEIKSIIFSYPEALGIHDLALHNYGPGRSFASVHVEVDGARDVYASHDAIDMMERDIDAKLGIKCVIHLDPIAVGDPETDRLHTLVTAVVHEIDARIDLHDFRMVPGTTHTNLIFDAVIPFEMCESDEELLAMIGKRITELGEADGEKYYGVITLERQ